jgi:phospholipid/cholesterol/gamma-HCH transport system ATP-binding protein
MSNPDVADHEPIISIQGLKTQFGVQVIHENLNMEIRRGEVVGVVGGSGTGKSVLLRTIIGLNRPAAGDILIFGENLAKLPDHERRKHEQRWGVLFQDGALFSSMTVRQNIQAPMKEHLNLSQQLMDEIAALKISMVGLPADAGSKYPSELSGGMRKRAGLARALALDPEIVFLDEPTAGLDPIGAAAFDDLVKQLQVNLGLTVFMITHDLDSLHAICDRIAVLAEKHVIAVEPLSTLLDFDHQWVQDYFHGKRARAAAVTNADNTKTEMKSL